MLTYNKTSVGSVAWGPSQEKLYVNDQIYHFTIAKMLHIYFRSELDLLFIYFILNGMEAIKYF